MSNENELLLHPINMPVTFHMPHINEMLISKYKVANTVKTANDDTPMSVIPANTAGWDMVHLTRISELNKRIQENRTSPAHFKCSFDDDDTALSATINGSFGTWQIERGGYGSFVNMTIPIAQGEIIINGKSIAIDSLSVRAQVDLEKLSQENASQDIKVISIQSPENCGVNETVRSILFHTIEVWLKNNNSEFSNILAIKNTGLLSSEEWLKPTSTTCVYKEGEDDSTSYLGLLCMTENKSSDGLNHRIPLTEIPENKKSLLMLGEHQILEKAHLPKLANRFGNHSINDTSFNPKVALLDSKIVANEVQTLVRINVNIRENIDVDIDITTYEALSFDTDPTKQQISFIESRDPEISYGINAAAGTSIADQDVDHITAIVDTVIQKYMEEG
ncbi:TULIP family P47-like protein [Paenibacillus alba]|uniref:TULIP family P47-like protein n=1 Tax=Paenibacillus alba TaxID=1197127 RepID=A0ABU6FZY1_9BACL|nr:TULIP family P47-like protein [Paenibacillus alba]MEC0227422.1 TULIP family P47-like protein [Paenibacillus alba]